MITLTVDGREVRVPEGATLLEAAREAGIYIPALCAHPDLPPLDGPPAAAQVFQGARRIENAGPRTEAPRCGLCVVEVQGRDHLVESCVTAALEGMEVRTDTPRIRAERQENLIPILARHPHACLTCAQQEGCARTQCSSNVPEVERCCFRFGRCELQDAAVHIGIPDATPRWEPTGLPVLKDVPLLTWDPNLCIGCLRCVRACRDLRGVGALGFVLDEEGRVRVGTLSSTFEASGCRFCTACVEVCPTGALADKDVRAGRREDLVPCREACPARVDVPGMARCIARGRPDEADAVVREAVPFPGVLGRVCGGPCEEVCRRAEINEPVAVCALKRYAADAAGRTLLERRLRAGPDTGKRVAVIGAGPAGLSAACFLRRAGHGVTLYEAGSEAGGMMRRIPRHRLPREVLDREVQDILDLGVDFRPGHRLGRDVHLEDLRMGYDAVFVGTGAQASRRPDVEGADLTGVQHGMEVLEKTARGDPPAPGKRVLVVGGGNVALDAARTALRSGAGAVTVACLELRGELPAHEWEVQAFLAEGGTLLPAWGLDRILGGPGGVRGVELVRCTRVLDDRGVFAPVFDRDDRRRLSVDRVILAVGQDADLSFLDPDTPVRVEHGRVVADAVTQETAMPGVYAGGDVTGAAGSVVHAAAAGRRAASAVDRALGGTGDLGGPLLPRTAPDPCLGREEGFTNRSRVPVPKPGPLAERFEEPVPGYDAEGARREAARCLQCDLRLQLRSNLRPSRTWLPFTREAVAQAPASEGVFQLQNGEGRVLCIQGTPDLGRALMKALEDRPEAALFTFEEHKMYSSRESELIRKHLQEHGEMPGEDELDELF